MLRRNFLFGLGATLVTAPAIVRAGSLMPVKQMLAIGDGVALNAMALPFARGEVVRDLLNEESLLAVMREIQAVRFVVGPWQK